MDRRNFLSVLGGGIVASALPYSLFPKKRNNQKLPNIIFILADDQHWGDYGFMGHPVLRTPNLDKFAGESQLYTRGWVTAPLCGPSCASIITGKYPHQTGITSNDPPYLKKGPRWPVSKWSKERKTLREQLNKKYRQASALPFLLKKNGYVSFQSGKWWGGHYSNGGFTSGMTHGDPDHGGRHGDEGLVIGRETMKPIYDFIRNTDNNPFFLWFAPFMPHWPHNPPERLLNHYKNKTQSIEKAKYWASCEWFDEACGALFDFLGKNKLEENTLIMFVSDNGWIQGEKERQSIRSKRSPYEAGIRTPIMLRWPGVIKPNRDTVTPVNAVDMVPTALHAAGFNNSNSYPGINLMNLQALRKRKSIFSADYSVEMLSMDPLDSLQHLCVLKWPWKLIVPSEKNVGNPQWPKAKKPYGRGSGKVELYDVYSDPNEQRNLAKIYPEKVKELYGELKKWWPEGALACLNSV